MTKDEARERAEKLVIDWLNNWAYPDCDAVNDSLRAALDAAELAFKQTLQAALAGAELPAPIKEPERREVRVGVCKTEAPAVANVGHSFAAEPPDVGDAGGWQPIETAPKDGTRILGADGETVEVIFWADGWFNQSAEISTWQAWPPTHWRPLPDPPRARSAGKPDDTPAGRE